VKPTTVWRMFDKDRDGRLYVERCSKCGTFKEDLMVHWFFTGSYCRNCIQYVLYCDFRTVEDINHES
jgi:late competence protein required for DNA uptake (superfamily II DNA/RNA helicase)